MQQQKAPVSFQSATAILETFEKRGLYEESVALLVAFLQEKLTRKEEYYSKFYLGKAYGFLHQHQEAKTYLFESLHYFEEVEDYSGRVECLNHLAFTFLRNGEIREAKTFLQLAKYNPIKSVYSTIIQHMILLDEKRYHHVLLLGEDILQEGNAYCVGVFYNNLGIAYDCLREIEKAIESYETSIGFFENCEYFVNIGAVANNLAMCYLSLNNYRFTHF
jgi:tetratricopeptide (TPR) repeat protein